MCYRQQSSLPPTMAPTEARAEVGLIAHNGIGEDYGGGDEVEGDIYSDIVRELRGRLTFQID